MSTRRRLTAIQDDRRGARARRSPAPRLLIPTASTAPEDGELAPQRRDERANRWSSSAAGSAVSPVWTGDGLHDRARRRGQPVEALGRLERGDRPARRRRRPPRARASAGARAPRPGRSPGDSAASAASSSSVRAARNPCRRREQHARRRSGTRRAPRAAPRARSRTGSPHARARSASSTHSRGSASRALEMLGVRRAVGPLRRDQRRRVGRVAPAAASRASASAIEPGGGQQHVVADRRERPPRRPPAGRRCRGARTAPRRGRSATGSRASAAGSGCAACDRRSPPARRATRPPPPAPGPAAAPGEYGSEPGRKSTPRFSPALARIRSWISGSGSARASSASTSTSTSSGTGSPSRARQLADHDLGRQRLRALAGAAELDHVQPVVVGLHDRGQRAALAQRASRSGWRSPSAARLASWRAMPTLLWEPPAELVERAVMTRYMRERGFDDYASLWRWSVAGPRGLLGARSGTSSASTGSYERVLASREMPGAEWFPGAEVNYAEHLFRGKDPDAMAIVHASELRELAELTLGRAARAGGADRRRPARARRRARRPRRGVHAEHPRGDRRLPGDGVDRRGLVELLARLRRRAR